MLSSKQQVLHGPSSHVHIQGGGAVFRIQGLESRIMVYGIGMSG